MSQPRRIRRCSALALVIAVAMTLPFALSSGTAGMHSVIVVAQGTGMSSWDPHDDISTHVTNIKRHLYGLLTDRNAELDLIPGLATEWELINDSTWQFKLREGVLFHNGEEFSADDVKYSLERAADPDLALHCQSFVATIQSVEIVDTYTVNVHTSGLDPILPARLAFCAFIAPAATIREIGMEEFVKQPVGTGPYTFVSWDRGEQVVLERNAGYWGEQPKNDRLIFKPIPEDSTRVSALRAGEIDIARDVPPDLVSLVERAEGLRTQSVPVVRNNFIILNKHVEPFGNQKVRQAMNYAVNVDEMVEELFGGHAVKTPTICIEAWFGCDMSQEPYPFDPAKARQLLTEAGYPDGFRTVLARAPGRPFASDLVTQAIRGYLEDVGISVEIQTFEWGEYLQRWQSGEFAMYYFSFGIPIPDLDAYIGGYFDPKRRATWGVPPERAVELAHAAMDTADPEERKALYSEFLAIIKEDAPFIFLFNFEEIFGVDAQVRGFTPRSDELLDMFNVYKETE